jgi:hypothetical protein
MKKAPKKAEVNGKMGRVMVGKMVDFGISKGFRDFDRIEWNFIGIS